MHTDNEYVLRQAVNKRDLNMVEYLASIGADLHVDEETPLRLAASKGDLPLVKYFVEQGANIHTRGDDAFKKAFLKVPMVLKHPLLPRAKYFARRFIPKFSHT